MQIETSGILINIRPFSERDVVAHIFTHDNGVLVGMLRGGAVAKKNRPLIGQIGNVSWVARLDSQLGTFHFESEKNLATPLMIDSESLKYMNAAFALIYTLLPERESYNALYEDTVNLLQNLASAQSKENTYLDWEISLLRELGYALDLNKCSGCQKTEDLIYLSPKTGRAVCADCGAPYVDKLYKLPINLNITKRFISAVCDVQGTDVPNARKIF
jgi:DNA repair protein RecO (recombination protein O)